jgi:hypothetical protein
MTKGLFGFADGRFGFFHFRWRSKAAARRSNKKKSKRLARLLRFFTENLEKMKTNRAQEDDIKTQTVDWQILMEK